MNDQQQRIEEIRERWKREQWYRAEDDHPDWFDSLDVLVDTDDGPIKVCTTDDDPVADMIANAPKDIAFLLAEVERLTEERAIFLGEVEDPRLAPLRNRLHDIERALDGHGSTERSPLSQRVAAMCGELASVKSQCLINLEVCEEAERERDEARAEVVRLKSSAIVRRPIETLPEERAAEVALWWRSGRRVDAQTILPDECSADTADWWSPLPPLAEEQDAPQAHALHAAVDRLPPAHQRALLDILTEGARARAKWGPQPHPWGEEIAVRDAGVMLENLSRDSLEGPATWAAILGEEAGEALSEDDPAKVRAEVVQVGAMALAALAECPDLATEEQDAPAEPEPVDLSTGWCSDCEVSIVAFGGPIRQSRSYDSPYREWACPVCGHSEDDPELSLDDLRDVMVEGWEMPPPLLKKGSIAKAWRSPEGVWWTYWQSTDQYIPWPFREGVEVTSDMLRALGFVVVEG